MTALLAAVDALNERLLVADSIAGSLEAAAGQEPPMWVHLFRQQVDGLQQAAEALEQLVRQGGAL